MARREVSADLLNRGFPFNVESFGSTVIINQGYELNRYPYVARGEDFQDVSGLPQCYFMQNVVPHVRGYSSMHFPRALAPHPFGSSVKVDQCHVIRDGDGNTVLYSPARGQNLIFDPRNGAWVRFPFGSDNDGKVTVAYLKGVTYICYEKTGLYVYDFQNQTFDEVFPNTVDFSLIIGVTAAKNYLVLYSEEAVFWSSGTDPLDFAPDLVTGAGATQVLSVKGQITVVLPIADGFIAYTTTNATGAQYSGVAGNPWIFREIPNSSGVGLAEHVSYESNEEVHIAWTTSGFQQVSFRSAKAIWPELTDTVGSGVFSDYDYTINRPIAKKFNQLNVKISSVGSKYTVVSVKGISDNFEFLVGYIWDWATKRWGKLRYPHADLIDFRVPEFTDLASWQDLLNAGTTWNDWLNLGVTWTAIGVPSNEKASVFGDNFGLIREDGSVYRGVFHPDGDSQGVDENAAYVPKIIFGRYKMARGKEVILHEVQGSVDSQAVVHVTAHDISTVPVQRELLTDAYVGTILNRYYCRLRADSVSVEISGRFNLTNLDMIYSEGGRRHQLRAG